MATLGDIRFRITKAFPGLDQDLVDGWINDRYTEILDALPWKRLEQTAVIQTIAPYEAGAVTFTAGSSQVTLTGGAFTAAMTGRAIRAVGADTEEYYEFTYVDPATGALDRAYEGTTGTYSFAIFQTIYQLPSDAKIVSAAQVFDAPQPMEQWSSAKLRATAPNRIARGEPRVWAPVPDGNTTPPTMQIEVYPVPDKVYGIPVTYTAEQGALTASSATLLPWTRPAAMVAGVTADVWRHKDNIALAREYDARFVALVGEMLRIDAKQRPPAQLKMAARFVRHRIQRAITSSTATNNRRLL